jgi:thiol-disulfide isomerase/thioredoxin
MKRLLAIVSLIVISLAAHGQEDPYARITKGDTLPSFEVVMMDGTTLRTADLEGKVVWITLWASWCPSCRKEFKRLAQSEEFAQLLESEEFVFLPIAREENVATVAAWLKERGYRFISGVDPTRAIYDLFAEQDIPRNIIVGSDGVVLHHSSTYSKKGLKEMIDSVKKMLN